MRLIDADTLKENIANNVYMVVDYFNSKDFGMFWTGGIEKIIDEQPTVTENRWIPVTERLPEIIQCKDCKYMTEHYDTDGNVPYWTCSEWDSGTDYDGFCHYAERRADE